MKQIDIQYATGRDTNAHLV